MTRYTVVWVESALSELSGLWIDAPDREAITAAAVAVDRLLGKDALTKGRALSEGLRSLIVPPLKVLFAVREQDRTAEVLCVRKL